MQKKKILICHTGGTIGMVRPMKSGAAPLRPLETDSTTLHSLFRQFVPELEKLADYSVKVWDCLDSCEVTPSYWERWLRDIKKTYTKYDGFIITHGTDTMAYSGSAFAFAMERTLKPIVFTGSQRPLFDLRSDARANLINAMEVACLGPAEITICFGNQLLRACRSSKVSSSDFVAFKSPFLPPLCRMGVNLETDWMSWPSSQRVPARSPKWRTRFDSRVLTFKIFPGCDFTWLSKMMASGHCRALLLEAYGSGTWPTQSAHLENIFKEAQQREIPVLAVSQCPEGRIDLAQYESGARSLRYGLLAGGDLTKEAALVKLMVALGQKMTYPEVRRYIHSNISGDRTSLKFFKGLPKTM